MHRDLILDRTLNNILAMLLVLCRDHLVGDKRYFTKLEALGPPLEFDRLVLVHVNPVLTVANGLGIRVITRIIQNIEHYLVVDQDQVAQEHAVGVPLELIEDDLVHAAVHDQITLLLCHPALVDGDFVGHVIDVEVQDVEYLHANFGYGSPDVRRATLYMAGLIVVLYAIKQDFAKIAVFNHGDLFGGRMVHDVVLVLDVVPLLAEPLRLHRADKAVFLARARSADHLVVQGDHMLFLAPQGNSKVVLDLSIKEHPV